MHQFKMRVADQMCDVRLAAIEEIVAAEKS